MVSCPKLETLLNYFIVTCGCDSPTTASENAYQLYYDVLFGITNFLCYERGFDLYARRNPADTTRTTKNQLRPDYIIQYNCLVLMRGEERRDLVKSYTAVEELTAKMRHWNVVLYGDLPYILGFTTAGNNLRVVAIERTDGPCRSEHILDVNIFLNKAGALKLFYNLAFLLHHMDITTKHPYKCGLIPFEPNDDEKRTIVLLDGGIERTIKSSGYSIKDFERIVDIYTKLQELSTEGSTTTHLQSVEESKTTEDGSLVVALSPVDYLRRPKVDELSIGCETC
ncbi:hypothetical protein V7S43_016356 [Phytophthora oleae]|uniref:Uncharacterized protein n=1 Tax=Phytophthora oleae TaxID=2107226 RepID=A0ABD3F069_9STRA